MAALSCTGQGSETCASQKEVIVTSSKRYAGWMQAIDVHGKKVTIFMIRVDSGLRLVWQDPRGYRITGTGKMMSGK